MPTRSTLALVAIAVIGVGTAPAATMAATVALESEPQARADQEVTLPGEPIPLSPLTDLSSLEATVTVTVDGTVDGKPTSGDLTAQLVSGEQGSEIAATGSLLGDIVAQVGGSAVKLFRPSEVSVYTVSDGTYVVVSGLFDLCIKPQDSEATAALDQLSPQALMTTLTSSDVARGTFVGDEMLDGAAVKHYAIDGEGFLAAAQASTDPNVLLFAQSLTAASDADLYVSEAGYPVAYQGSFEGAFAPLGFEGMLAVDIELTGINGDASVMLPDVCDNPIAG